jgi:hypothetical protein
MTPVTPPSAPRARDILLSIVVLLPLIGLVALFGRGCSFAPAGPTVDPGSAPKVDATATLVTAAGQLPFPVRAPRLPATWRANSTDRRPAPGGLPAVRVGWITESGRYLRLVQTGPTGDEAALVSSETQGAPQALGVADSGGRQWVRYAAPRDEQAWVTSADGARWLITGSGTEAEFRTLAAALGAAAPLPRG